MDFYKSEFEIVGDTGNNCFSFKDRRQKSIFVPSLKEEDGIIPLLALGKTAFCEIEDAYEHNCKGLEFFFYFLYENVPVYIFDNHNHSFFFTVWEQLKNEYEALRMIHIDQHKDMREPSVSWQQYKSLSITKREEFIKENTRGFLDSYSISDDQLSIAYEYGNLLLNVGDYIVPLKEGRFINDVKIVDSSYSLKNLINYCENEFFLNLDLDFFSKDMDYIDFEEKIKSIKTVIKKAKFILIATSPYFINSDRCQRAINKIFI